MALVGLEEGMAALEDVVGKTLPRYTPWIKTASRDSIRHVAYALGDDNPMWCDEGYAASGPYGGLVAPPLFFQAIDDTHVTVGLPGYQGLYMGAEWSFHDVVRLGTTVRASVRLSGIEKKETRRGGTMVLQRYAFEFVDADTAAPLASAVNMSGRVVPPEGKESGGIRYETQPVHVPGAEERARIQAARAAYTRRGAVPRWFEDVEVDDPLPMLVHGPLSALDFAAYYAGYGTTGPAPNCVHLPRWRYEHDFSTAEISRGSGKYRDETGFYAYSGRGHLDSRLAKQMGMPGAFDVGASRAALLSRLVTDWMGDQGRLRSLSTQVRRPIVIGDVMWVTGRVAGVSEADGEHLVSLELWSDDQNEQRTTLGTASVVLASKEGQS